MTEIFGEPFDKKDEVEKENQEPESYLGSFLKEDKTLEEVAEELAKKAVHADKFIETLKSEKEALRADFEDMSVRVKTTDDILTAIRQSDGYEKEPEPVEVDNTPSGPSLTEEDIEARFNEYEKKKEREKKINDKFWSDMTTGLNCSVEEARARILKYTGDDEGKIKTVTVLGANDPASLVSILKNVTVEKFTNPPSGGSPDPKPVNTNRLVWSKVKEIRKKDPIKANSWAFKKAVTEAIKSDPEFYNL